MSWFRTTGSVNAEKFSLEPYRRMALILTKKKFLYRYARVHIIIIIILKWLNQRDIIARKEQLSLIREKLTCIWFVEIW